MEQLSTIRNRISSELDEMNRIIVESLHTKNKMMDDVVCSYLEKKGKQIRPIMVILSAKMFGNVTPEVLYAGASLEMLHNASLIHDDVVDETELRRGVPTLNARMGNRIAVLVGDYFVSCALACSLNTHSTSAVASLSSLGKELSLGEIDQICNAREHHFDEKSYYDMIRQKTASLFIHCVKMGAEMNGANEEQIGHMIRFGELLGLCFQIKDDIFDYFDSKEIGKPTGNDLREGKMTLPLLYALAHGPQDEAAELKEIICGDDLTEAEISRLIQFAKDNGGIEYAYYRMREMQQEAAVELSHFADCEAKQSFLDIFEFIISRNH
jgi:octaprenyl-diphosphate synthase